MGNHQQRSLGFIWLTGLLSRRLLLRGVSSISDLFKYRITVSPNFRHGRPRMDGLRLNDSDANMGGGVGGRCNEERPVSKRNR